MDCAWHRCSDMYLYTYLASMISPTQLFNLEIGRKRLSERKKRHTLQQLFWECTLRCNLNCRHCGSDCRSEAGVADMSLEKFITVLDEIKKIADPRHVLIITTGGEPLVRQDIAECGRQITKRGFLWGMVSNGHLLSPQKLDELIAAGLRTIAISLDGFERDHNWMRGNPYSFQRAVEAIKALTKRSIIWDVITCVNKRNFSSLERFRDFLIDLGVCHWRIFTVFPSGRAKDDDQLQLSDCEYKSLMDFIAKERKSGRINVSYSCEGFLGRYEGKVRGHQYFCQAGINVASILADGSISGCLSIRGEYHQGNIRDDSFSDVWENRFKPYRDRSWMKTGICSDCKFWRYCEGNGMHLRNSDGTLAKCNLHQLM